MSDLILKVTDETFESKVLNSPIPTLIDFYAPWCNPCKSMLPIIEDLATEYNGRLNLVKIDVDESPNSSSEYGIRSIPFFVAIKDGQLIATLSGSKTKAQLKSFMEEIVNS